MGSIKPLTAKQRKSRKEIRELIGTARRIARIHLSHDLEGYRIQTARLLDDLADIAEKYLKTTNRSDE